MIKSGDSVIATDTHGAEHSAVALTPVERTGHNFPVIWLKFDDGSWDRVPWPADQVRLREAVG